MHTWYVTVVDIRYIIARHTCYGASIETWYFPMPLSWYATIERMWKVWTHLFIIISLSRLCPSTAGCSPPSMSSIVVCLLLSKSRWFPPSLLCHLAIFCLVVLWASSLSLVATLCVALSTYCSLVLLYDRPISIFISVCILWHRWSLFFFWFPSTCYFNSSLTVNGLNSATRATRLQVFC